MAKRVLLLLPTTTYKVRSFMDAAFELGVQVAVGSEKGRALEKHTPGKTLTVNYLKPAQAAEKIVRFHEQFPLHAIIGTDDETVVLAAVASERIGLSHNRPRAVRASRDKEATRRAQQEAGMRHPGFRRVRLDEDLAALAETIDYPCVIKPVFLSAGRGVMKATSPREFLAASLRIGAILEDPEVAKKGGAAAEYLLVEDYIPGDEVTVEALLDHGVFRLLAIFDKPDRLDGPVFQETMFVTPSRQSVEVQAAIAKEAQDACAALGLRHGPVHVEMRINEGVPWLLEVAARSIGGLCSQALKFGTGHSLEELILRHALGLEPGYPERESQASGVLMLPIEQAGVLREVRGMEAATQVPGVTGLTVSMKKGARLMPPPEGNSYLGFLFATGSSPARVEESIRAGWDCLEVVVD
jgi:biotin carboxylase